MLHHRALAASAALLGWFGLVLQLWFSVRMTLARGGTTLDGVWLFLGFYTILTNLLVAAALSTVAMGPAKSNITRFLQRPGVQTAIAMSIIIVSLIYNLMLRQLWHPHGWLLVSDVIVHDLMPVLYLLHWWLMVPKQELRWTQALIWQSYPAGYFFYVLLRGAANGWYPYPFLGVPELGYVRVLINAIVVLMAFIAVALSLIALGRWQVRRRMAATLEIA